MVGSTAGDHLQGVVVRGRRRCGVERSESSLSLLRRNEVEGTQAHGADGFRSPVVLHLQRASRDAVSLSCARRSPGTVSSAGASRTPHPSPRPAGSRQTRPPPPGSSAAPATTPANTTPSAPRVCRAPASAPSISARRLQYVVHRRIQPVIRPPRRADFHEPGLQRLRPPQRPQYVERVHVARTFPDRVQRRLPEEERQPATPRRTRSRRDTPTPRPP